MQGVMRWFSFERGYGFVAPDDGSKDVFVHVTSVDQSGLDTLAEGDKIEFEVAADLNGRVQARNLRRVA